MKIIGIYRITNLITGVIYIGSAQDIINRWTVHRSELNRRVHGNNYLQRAWNKYGVENFEFGIIEQCERENLIAREQYWFDLTKCYERDKGYNLKPNAASPLGYKLSEQHKANIGKAHLGRKRPPETGQKISARNKGKVSYRKFDRWPHELGNKCPCKECKAKWRIKRREYDDKRRNVTRVFYTMLPGVSL